MNQRPIIQTATDADIPDVLSFVLQARAELFPKLGATGMPADWHSLRRFTFTVTVGF